MKIKIYIIILFLSLINFGCKQKVTNVYEGTLIHKDDVPFSIYTFEDMSDIFLKTSINDSDFPDGIRYYRVFPKDEYYQDFQNNIGNKVSVEGKETIIFSVPDSPDIIPGYTPPEKPYLHNKRYDLEEAKIVKVY